jgi:RNA polymerase-binding protein DksA
VDKKEKQQYKKRLIDLREELSHEIRQVGGDNIKQSQREASGDLSAYTLHMADVASDSYDRELTWDRASAGQQVLFYIDEALKKIDEGTYGLCDDCGKRITKERLKAIPYVRLCRDCKQKNERPR